MDYRVIFKQKVKSLSGISLSKLWLKDMSGVYSKVFVVKSFDWKVGDVVSDAVIEALAVGRTECYGSIIEREFGGGKTVIFSKNPYPVADRLALSVKQNLAKGTDFISIKIKESDSGVSVKIVGTSYKDEGQAKEQIKCEYMLNMRNFIPCSNSSDCGLKNSLTIGNQVYSLCCSALEFYGEVSEVDLFIVNATVAECRLHIEEGN